ncbi:MAG: c-type cytochrome [bacterium]|nr:c-type cytochrome [bacterium]
MKETLLGIVQVLIVIYLAGGLSALAGRLRNRDGWTRAGLWIMTIAGPVSLAVCWKAQVLFRAEDAIFWSRLMAGDTSIYFAIGSVGIIAGSGLALGALSLGQRPLPLFSGAVFFAAMWYIIYLHPTPHYVPLEPWQDKLVWFILVVGGAGASLATFLLFKPFLNRLETPVTLIAASVSFLSIVTLAGFEMARRPLELAEFDAAARIRESGCLACHSMNGEGFPEPGGGLESVASRTEDVVIAFLTKPDGETAKELDIRQEPTGEMGGVHLNEAEVAQFTEALKTLFEVKPPSKLGPGWERVEEIFVEKTCLACHTYKGEGAPGGGLGGPFEKASERDRDILVKWLMAPTFENAIALKISESPMGAMTAFPLPKEDAELVADWLKSIKADDTP